VDRRFAQVDVFTDTPLLGNPVAVVLDGEGLETEAMQRIARWTNLSETTFLLAPSDPRADYRLRIFTPDRELPFAGHPTLGSAHAWLESVASPLAGAARSEILQECAAGLVRLRLNSGRLAFAAPPLIRSGPVEEALVQRISRMLGLEREDILDSRWVDNGPGWVAVLLRDAESVLALSSVRVELELGVVGLHPPDGQAAVEVRAFFVVDGATVEDPVTGSLNASLAEWLISSGRVRAPYVAAQGAALGRRGRVHIDTDRDGTIWVGGGTFTCVNGTLSVNG
jgi:PhzF family phenazine biosynthesis protein